ncbi:MAG: DUF6273 domain-containing protein [Candidatus Dehalobacter alkaniphilus]
MSNAKCAVKPGSIIPFGGMDWIVLEADSEKILVLAKESIGNIPFDKNESNDWKESSLKKYLNTDFLKKLDKGGAVLDNIVRTTFDLTADDGLDDYGTSDDLVGLLTVDQYRKHRRIIPNLDNWWWLITPYSTEKNGYSDSVRRVLTDGTLSSYFAYHGILGVRPALNLKSCILESVEVKLEQFTTTELLNELVRRNNEQ